MLVHLYKEGLPVTTGRRLMFSFNTWRGLRLGSKVSEAGSMLTGDCRRPLLHIVHAGFIRPQYAENQLISLFHFLIMVGTSIDGEMAHSGWKNTWSRDSIIGPPVVPVAQDTDKRYFSSSYGKYQKYLERR